MKGVEKISISILDIDILKLKEKLEILKYLGIICIHIDIIDTSFTNNISFGISTINAILQNFKFEYFIHIMTDNPILILEKLGLSKIRPRIAVHSHFQEILRIEGIIPVLAINPDDNIESIGDMLIKFQEILIMGVYPGFGGQSLIESCIPKILKCQKLGKRVTIDGGINIKNIGILKHADCIVIGSELMKSEDPNRTLDNLTSQL